MRHTKRWSHIPARWVVAGAAALAVVPPGAALAQAPASAPPSVAAQPVAGPSSAVPVSPTQRWQCVATGPARAEGAGCRVGAPVRLGELVAVPRVCRLSLQGRAVERHTIEWRDIATLRSRGKASLPPSDAVAGAAVAEVGALLVGDPPLYVWAGGVAALDLGGRRLEAVMTADHAIAGVARRGDLLAVVEAHPADTTFAAGSLAWTVLDSGSGKMLGARRVAGTALAALGIEAPTGARAEVWLRMAGKDGLRDLVGAVALPGVEDGVPVPAIAVKVVPARATAAVAGPPGRCGMLVPATAAVVAHPVAAGGAGTAAIAAVTAEHAACAQCAGCLGVLAPQDDGSSVAMVVASTGPALQALRCLRAAGPDATEKSSSTAAPPGR